MFRRTIPLIFAFTVGTFMVVQFFIPHPTFLAIYNGVLDWQQVIFGFVLIVGTLSMVRHHIMRLKFKKEGYQYSMVALAGLILMISAGIYGGIRGGPYKWLFDYVQMPTQASMFSLLAFFVASASYRAFRARNVTATLLLLAGVIVMLGRVPAGEYIRVGDFSMREVAIWILDYPNTAAKRGILIGVGLGMSATALKIILGIETSYLGKGE